MSRYRIAAPVAIVILVLAVLIGAQIALPSIAAQHIRDQLKKSGRVISVSVSAFPAIELLWHHADTVKVKMASYHSNAARLNTFLNQASDTGSLDASAEVITVGLLTVHDASLHKRGNSLTGNAQVDLSDLRHAIPQLTSLTPVASTGGQLEFDATLNIAGLGGTVPITVQPQDGAIIGAPDLPLVGSLFTIRVFSDPHVSVDSLSATRTSGGFAVSATGQLH